MPLAALDAASLDLQMHIEERAHRMGTSYSGSDPTDVERNKLDESQPRYLCSLDVPRTVGT